VTLRYSERELRAKAERVIAGTQTGQYKKLDMARDLITLLDRIDRMRGTSQDEVEPESTIQTERRG
jgi:hypothetical protein